MTQTLAISKAIDSMSQVRDTFGLIASSDEQFFTEWYQDLPPLTEVEQQTLDRYKQRFLLHHDRGELPEGTVDRLLVSPLLDLAGLYEPEFTIEAEASVELSVEDEVKETAEAIVYRGRLDVLIIKRQFWLLVVEEKATRIAMETALPQGLAYMAAHPTPNQPVFGLVTNGNHFLFIKLQQREYALSDSFALRSRQNKLYEVVQILKQIRDRISVWKTSS
jgi:hypothetical protein